MRHNLFLSLITFTANPEQIKLRFFIKAPLRGAFIKNLSLGLFSICCILVSSGISIASAEENKPISQEKYEYPQEVTKTFMKGCGFTSNKEFCTCSLDKLRSQYTFAEFLKIDTAVRETKQVPQEVISLFQSCRPKVSQ